MTNFVNFILIGVWTYLAYYGAVEGDEKIFFYSIFMMLLAAVSLTIGIYVKREDKK